MFRKIAAIALSLVIVSSVLSGCSSPNSPDGGSASSAPSASPSASSTPETTPSSEPPPSSTPEPTPEAPAVKLVPPAEMVEYPEGMYKIGADMPAGVYFAMANEGAVMASVTVKDGSGTDAKPLAVDAFQVGHTMIAVAEGEYLDVIGCTLIDAGFTKTFLADIGAENIPEGMYLVGFHITAGEYKTVADEGAVLSSLTVFEDASQQKPLDVQIVNGSGYITLKDGEYVRLRGVHLEK